MKHCDSCRCNEIAPELAYRERMRKVSDRLEAGDKFIDDELRYAAYARCECGAGLAYPKDSPLNGYWDCSDVLTGRVSGGQFGNQHSPRLPFVFYEIKSEDQPSANGATTRNRVGVAR